MLGWWGEEHKEPWLILSDLTPHQGDPSWYGLRGWIEQGFKDSKRGGWQWQRTRMEDPQRAERLWLAMAATTLWLLRVGGVEADEAGQAEAMPSAQHEHPRHPIGRLSSVFAQGHKTILMALCKQRPLPLGRWLPQPWPHLPPPRLQ